MRFALAFLLCVLALPAAAVDVTASWTPASGPVLTYDVLVSRDGGPLSIEDSIPASSAPQATIEADIGEVLVVRVAARSGDRVGPMSEPSDPFTVPDLTPLGQPGKVKLSVTITIESPQ